MSRYVAFLRGVTPQNPSKSALCQCLEASGYAEVRTVLSNAWWCCPCDQRSVSRSRIHVVALPLGRGVPR